MGRAPERMGNKIRINEQEYEIIREPVPHIVVRRKKFLHGWWPGKRECTGERFLINPYNGCSISCPYCYARGFRWGYFDFFDRYGVATVWEDFDKVVAAQLDAIDVAACGYLSPVTDPFQALNKRYRLAEKIIKVFVERNIPIEFITKGRLPDEAIELIARQEHSFGQVSITTAREKLRKILSPGPGAARVEELFDNIKRITSATYTNGRNVFAVCRIDPVFPFITDSKAEIEEIIVRAKEAGARHIIGSCLDIPMRLKVRVMKLLYKLNPSPPIPYEKLYCEVIDGYYHADINYRRDLFSMMRQLCQEHGLSFALCMEYELIDEPYLVPTASGRLKEVRARGLNSEFMFGTRNCEGIDIPIYIRGGEEYYVDSKGRKRGKFIPAADCDGACLYCKNAVCGIPQLAMGVKPTTRKDFVYRDYKKWSRELCTLFREGSL